MGIKCANCGKHDTDYVKPTTCEKCLSIEKLSWNDRYKANLCFKCEMDLTMAELFIHREGVK